MKWKTPAHAILVCAEKGCRTWFECSDSEAIELHGLSHYGVPFVEPPSNGWASYAPRAA
jgi:hypothetical protein